MLAFIVVVSKYVIYDFSLEFINVLFMASYMDNDYNCSLCLKSKYSLYFEGLRRKPSSVPFSYVYCLIPPASHFQQ